VIAEECGKAENCGNSVECLACFGNEKKEETLNEESLEMVLGYGNVGKSLLVTLSQLS